MTRIKICGITNAEDARAAVRLGASALGIIGIESSPRYILPEMTPDIFREAKPFVPVFVLKRRADEDVGYESGYVQFYEGVPDRHAHYLRVFRIKDGASLEQLVGYNESVAGVVLDAYHESALGGTGKTFDWRLAVTAKGLLPSLPLILAGGLTPENVFDAVRAVRPHAVDVSSGVEAEPGRKDHDKLRRFIEAVREADRE
ncbi:MAG: phosphoribosylanthranilate isomerase [Fibrella sp.]|nr:phosphoribosylanthranilate isomerase [Armatimonadota bacterium]